MKIYFAGSISGGREDAALYRQLIEHLKQYGQVLTEHVGNENVLKTSEKKLSDKNIHDRDEKWLMESDIVVAETTIPSLGVGYEIALARQYEKRLLCLYRSKEGKKLSAMIAGAPHVTVVEYFEVTEGKAAIDRFIA